MGDVVAFPRRATALLSHSARPPVRRTDEGRRFTPLPSPVPGHKAAPEGWPDDTRVVDKLTGRTGAVCGRGWSCTFTGVCNYSVRWDDCPDQPADIAFASRLMLLRPTPRDAVVTLPGGRTLRRLPPGAGGDPAATWAPAPDFDEPPPGAA